VDEKLRHAEGKALERGSERIRLGPLDLRSAEQAPDGAAPEPEPGSLRQVAHAGLRDRVRHPDDWTGPGRSVGQAGPRPGPERQVPAGGMPDCDDPAEVERHLALDHGEMVDRGRHVRERRRPPAAGPQADAPVLDVPGDPPAGGEVAAEAVVQMPVVPALPEPAVQDDGNGSPRVALRPEELADLAPVLVPVPPNLLDAGNLGRGPDRKEGPGVGPSPASGVPWWN
jgi:hypothetical protein